MFVDRWQENLAVFRTASARGMRDRKATNEAVMRNPASKILLAAAVASLPTWVVAAEKARQPADKPAAKPAPVQSNPCAIYGAGFVRIEGSSTCVKIGGHVTIDVGTKVGR
jgi:hypothetical protein